MAADDRGPTTVTVEDLEEIVAPGFRDRKVVDREDFGAGDLRENTRVTKAASRQRSSTLQEPQIERPEHHPDVHHQPLPKSIPEEKDVHADHDTDHHKHVEHDGCLSSRRGRLAAMTKFRGWRS
jgi:hypothetical protein